MLTEFGSEYEPAGGGDTERGIGASELSAFLDTVASEAAVSERKSKLGRKMANAEIPVVLKYWPSVDASGNAYVAESTFRAFYSDHLFPVT